MTYADLNAPLVNVLHGSARLHVALAKMDGLPIATRDWTYNDLVSGALALRAPADTERASERMACCLETIWDTLDAVCEIGPRGVNHLAELAG